MCGIYTLFLETVMKITYGTKLLDMTFWESIGYLFMFSWMFEKNMALYLFIPWQRA